MEPGIDKYRLLMKRLPDAFAYHRIVTDSEGKPVDYIFLDVNPAFEKMTGLLRDNVIGRKVTEVLPGIKNGGFDWIGTYGRVALDKEATSFEQYSGPLERWYEVTAYSDEPGSFVVLFRDITSSKKEKEALQALFKFTQKNLQQSVGTMDYQRLTDHLLQLSGARLVAINTYEEEGTKTVTRAISGIAENIRRASEILGFELAGHSWDVIPERTQSIRNGRLVRFENLYEAGSGTLSKQISFLLEKMFGLGEVYVVEIGHQGQSLGDFIIILPRGQTIKNPDIVELYANQAGIVSLRMQTDQALRESEARYRQLIDTLQEGIWVIDKDGYTTYANQVMADMIGYTVEEMCGKHLFEFIDEEQAKETDQYVLRRMQGIKERHESKLIHKDGHHVVAELKTGPMLDEDGNYNGAIAGVQDITERKRAEEALKEEEAKYRGIFEAVRDALLIFNKEGIIVEANPAACRIYNYTRQELVGLSGREVVHPDYQHLFLKFKNDVQEKGYFHAESVDVRSDGSTFHNVVNGTAILFNGRDCLLAIVRDITDRKQAEETLQQSEERYRLLIENANEAIIVAQDGFNVFCNPKAIEFFARTKDELKSIPFLDFIYPEDRQKVMESHNKRMSGEKKTEHYSFRIIDGNNNIKWAELHGTVITWNNKNASLNLMTDITNRKEAEQKLHDYTMELELKGIELENLYQQLDQELDKARAIHERTLPKDVPQIEGLSLHAYYQPAQRMGGDFYNAIQVGYKLILYISDVSGHGLEGALLSSFVKATIDSYVILKPEEIDPEAILCHLNRQYRRENYPGDYFVCIFLMVLDINSMELTYTGAGFQELPLVHMGSGEKMRLHTEGPPISSAIPEEIMDFATGKIFLRPGTTVLVNTDGITEQQVGEEQYNGRLEQVFYEHSHLPPENIMNAIKDDFYRFNGGSMQGDDDITLGIIQI